MNIPLTETVQHLSTPQSTVSDCRGMGSSMSERQQAQMKWQQESSQHQQDHLNYMISDSHSISMFHSPADDETGKFQALISSGDRVLVTQAMEQYPVIDNRWHAFNNISRVEDCTDGAAKALGFNINYKIPRTISCPPAAAAAMAEAAAASSKDGTTTEMPGNENLKKRKINRTQSQKVKAEEVTGDKKMKGCPQDGDSRIAEHRNDNSTSNNSNSDETSKENSKVSEVQKPDYIHVRARRGQATDSHSLAERVRREKISERMKYLQDLVPGCNKIIGKAGMLDEIINYVQSLQRQVEFLSMKLAAVNPTTEFSTDSLFAKETACTNDLPTTKLPSEMANPGHVQFNPSQQVVPCSVLETSVSPDMALRRTISAPVSFPEMIFDQSIFDQIHHSSTWDAELLNLYAMEFQHGKLASAFTQPFTGYIEADHVKLEM